MADPLGGDQFDVEQLAEAEVEKLMKQVSSTISILSINFIYLLMRNYFLNVFCFILCSVSYY